MDGDAFDRIARFWGTCTDRRRALRLLGAGVIAGTWFGRGKLIAAQTSTVEMTCLQDADCLDGDIDPCTGGACVDGLCTYFIVDCIPGHTCCGNGACCPTGEPGSCMADTDCVPMSSNPCEGIRCEGGACVPFLATCAPDFICCGNGTCCPSNGGCATDSDCSALSSSWGLGTRCVSGVCVPTPRPI